MNISDNTIKKLLEVQGKMDFKPFICEGIDKEIWAYRTNDNLLHFCDRDLEPLDRYDLQLTWGLFVILSTTDEYRLISKGIEVSDINESINDTHIEGWIIDCNDKIVKRIQNFVSYRIIDHLLIFNAPKQDFLISNDEGEYWIPKDRIQCFYEKDGEFEETNTYYCGTFRRWDLFFTNNQYYIEEVYYDPSYYHKIFYFDNPVFWFSHDSVHIIDIHKKEDVYELRTYSLVIEKERYLAYCGQRKKYLADECNCIGNYDLRITFDPDKYDYYVDTNYFLICASKKNQQYVWMTKVWGGELWRTHESKTNDSVYFNNGIMKIKMKNQYTGETEYKYVNYKGEPLAAGLDVYRNYFIVSKEFDTTIIGAENYDNPQNERIRFYGIVNGMSGELVVPIKYDYLELYDGFDYFYAVIKVNNTDENGEIKEQYGLMYNGNMILPCNNSKIQVFNKNLFVINDGVKYRIISNGKICIADYYDKISPEHKSGKKYLPTGKSTTRLTNYDYCWAVLQRGDLIGLYSPDWDLYIEPQFSTIDPLIEEKFLLADMKLYKVENNHISLERNMSDYDYIGGCSNYHLFLLKNTDHKSLDSYVCFHLKDAQLKEEIIEDIRNCYELESDVFKYISMWKFEPILCIGSIFYSVSEKCFKKSLEDFADYPTPDPDEGYNNERDTYYALGGSDYDRWKDEGGDLDSMMDGMGY